MMRFAGLVSFVLLAACSDAASAPCTSSDAGPDVATDVADLPDATQEAAAPCALRIDGLAPASIPAGAGGVLVRVKGCAFTGVRDVQVNVMSVPFVVVDDTTLVFASLVDVGPGPYKAEVDIIKIQPDQAQTFLVYE